MYFIDILCIRTEVEFLTNSLNFPTSIQFFYILLPFSHYYPIILRFLFLSADDQMPVWLYYFDLSAVYVQSTSFFSPNGEIGKNFLSEIRKKG